MAYKIYPGSAVTHVVSFFETDGSTPVDPTTVKLRLRSPWPAGETLLVYGVDAEIVRTGVGIYTYKQTYAFPGRHHRRWEGSGNVDIILEEWSRVEQSAFGYLFEMPAAAAVTTGSPIITSPTLTEN